MIQKTQGEWEDAENIKRPIFVELSSEKLKKEIFRNAKFLNGKNLYVGSDFAKEIIEVKKYLKPYPRRAKLEGKRDFLPYEKLV